MPPEQEDLFARIHMPAAPPRVINAPARVVPEVKGDVVVHGVGFSLTDLERELNVLHRAATGPLVHTKTFGQTGLAIARAAWPYDHLRGRASAVIRVMGENINDDGS